MDTTALAAQLIGEEPGFDVVLQTAISDRKFYLFLYTTRTLSGQMFSAWNNYLTESNS
jgi:hypothetical protein